jgi:N-dimethylarginine dimethylaminohydrolase
MSDTVYKAVTQLKGFSVKNCVAVPEPAKVLMCPPDHYEARDERNPFASGDSGRINPHLARKQWVELRDAFAAAGLEVALVPAAAGLIDMVFCANHTFAGLTGKMERLCVISSMRAPSHRREVVAFESWFREAGYRVVALKDQGLSFGGAGDALWHPGRRLIWGGCGFRSDAGAYDELARLFATPVVLLKLVNERFPHLDTCFCPLTQEAVLIYPSAFDAASLELIFRLFPIVITASEPEALRQLACNAVVIRGRTALMQRGALNAAHHVAAMGLEIVPVDVSEFIKSGGGAHALKMFVY